MAHLPINCTLNKDTPEIDTPVRRDLSFKELKDKVNEIRDNKVAENKLIVVCSNMIDVIQRQNNTINRLGQDMNIMREEINNLRLEISKTYNK